MTWNSPAACRDSSIAEAWSLTAPEMRRRHESAAHCMAVHLEPSARDAAYARGRGAGMRADRRRADAASRNRARAAFRKRKFRYGCWSERESAATCAQQHLPFGYSDWEYSLC